MRGGHVPGIAIVACSASWHQVVAVCKEGVWGRNVSCEQRRGRPVEGKRKRSMRGYTRQGTRTHPRQKLRSLRVRARVLGRNVGLASSDPCRRRHCRRGVYVAASTASWSPSVSHPSSMSRRIHRLRHRSRVSDVFLYSDCREGDKEGTLQTGTRDWSTQTKAERRPPSGGNQSVVHGTALSISSTVYQSGN